MPRDLEKTFSEEQGESMYRVSGKGLQRAGTSSFIPKSSCFKRQQSSKRPTSSTGCSGGNVIGVVKWHCLQYLSI